MCIFFILIVLAIGTAALAAFLTTRQPEGIGGRVATMAGIALSLGSFFFLPWIKFAPIAYLFNIGSEMVGDAVPKALETLLRVLGLGELGKVLALVGSLGGAPAWVVMVAIPTTDILVRLVILLVPITAGLSLLWLPLSFLIKAAGVRRVAGIGQASTAFLAALLLLFKMPAIDALAQPDSLLLRFAALLSGARMSTNVWLAWIGLLLLIVGGLLEVLQSSQQPLEEEPPLDY